MLTGRIKKYDRERGFGFIARDDGEPDVFLHATAMPMELREAIMADDRVVFDVVSDPNGRPRAADVRAMPSADEWIPDAFMPDLHVDGFFGKPKR